MKTLHILNGDASVSAFEASALEGDVLVWREIMSEGPVKPQVQDDTFWEMRQEYIVSNYGEAAEAYKAKVLDLLPQLKHPHGYAELVLWFDSDLMCQINLLFLLYYIKEQHHQTISVASPAQAPVSQLSGQQFQEEYAQRVKLRSDDLNLACQLWQAYADESPLLLQELRQGDLSPFRHLPKALDLHFQRYPSCKTGLNQIETLLLQLIEGGVADMLALQQAVWQTEPGYGYGDLQLNLNLRKLSPELVQQHAGKLQITENGRKVLHHQLHIAESQSGPTAAADTKADGKSISWCWDEEKGKIVAATKNTQTPPSENLA